MIEQKQLINLKGFVIEAEAVGEPQMGAVTTAVYEETVLEHIDADIRQDPKRERGGILFGEYQETPLGRIVYVRRYVPIVAPESTYSSLDVSKEDVLEISEKIQKGHPELQLVGDVHSHPCHRLFPSWQDLSWHFSLRQSPDYIIMIADPAPRVIFQYIKNRLWFSEYRVQEGRLKQPGGYYISNALT